ncbi:spore germination protein [Caldanaerobius fijiensis DSM 17918]|uniref:Spore germination protein n=1 Tax=Caldanaerobius fijiensis DSM 17918 TaxID=1121256 RepID=A0A1M4Z693_9THEO|nr:endospore germination permease [Caldanaerobius fijiensis]SHF13534.1 spore germination protein [Caldanaerobius fijiensis DSM 17918]
MIKNDDKITSTQLASTLIIQMLGIASLSLPRDVATQGGSSGWTLVVLGALAAMVFSLVVTRLGRMFVNDTFVEYSKKIVGNFLGNVLSFMLVVYFIFFAAVQVRVFAEVLKMFLLYYTPLEIVIITMLLSSLYIVRHGIEPIARLNEIMLPVFVLTAILVLLPTLKDIDFTNLLPLMKVSPWPFAKGIIYTAFLFTGFEFMLFLVPFLKKPQESSRYTVYAIGIAGVLNLMLVILSTTVFGVKENTHLVWPVISLIKIISVPGFFVENLEGIMIGIWTLSVFTTLDTVLYIMSLGLSRVTGAREHSYIVLVLVPIIYIVAMSPADLVQTFAMFRAVSVYGAAALTVVVPLLLLLIARIRNMRGGNDVEEV